MALPLSEDARRASGAGLRPGLLSWSNGDAGCARFGPYIRAKSADSARAMLSAPASAAGDQSIDISKWTPPNSDVTVLFNPLSASLAGLAISYTL